MFPHETMTIAEIQRSRRTNHPSDREILERAYYKLFGEPLGGGLPPEEEIEYLFDWAMERGLPSLAKEALRYL